MNKRESIQLRVVIQKLDNIKQYNEHKFDDVEKNFTTVNKHLEELNDSVADNTKFRYTLKGAFKVTGYIFGGGGIISVIIYTLISVLI